MIGGRRPGVKSSGGGDGLTHMCACLIGACRRSGGRVWSAVGSWPIVPTGGREDGIQGRTADWTRGASGGSSRVCRVWERHAGA